MNEPEVPPRSHTREMTILGTVAALVVAVLVWAFFFAPPPDQCLRGLDEQCVQTPSPSP